MAHTAACSPDVLDASCSGSNQNGSHADAALSAGGWTENKNAQAHIDLLRQGVRQQKAEIMGSIMLLNAADAAKF
jgi:hypothetical protein